MTPEGSLDLPRTETEFRAERLGIALRGLAAELVDERRKDRAPADDPEENRMRNPGP